MGRSYRIGSFNMKRFGKVSARDFDVIANIIRDEQLDIVALQEVFSQGEGIPKILESCVKYGLNNWKFCWEKPQEPEDNAKRYNMQITDTRGEGYAYLWNTRKFKLAEFKRLNNIRQFEPRIINSKSTDVRVENFSFARTPYYIRFMPVHGGFFEIRLLNIHIYFGAASNKADIERRKEEFRVLTQKIYPAISQRRYGDFRSAYTIAMGDYNLNLIGIPYSPEDEDASISGEYQYRGSHGRYTVRTIQDQLTTLKKCNASEESEQILEKERYSNNFDHFSYIPELSHMSGVRCWRVDAVNKYCKGDFAAYNSKISDHLPIVMEIDI